MLLPGRVRIMKQKTDSRVYAYHYSVICFMVSFPCCRQMYMIYWDTLKEAAGNDEKEASPRVNGMLTLIKQSYLCRMRRNIRQMFVF